ncbi:MAG TPA: hypothetical protein PLF51_13125, partial [Candidatus Hydrogenedentes bacterium]|nr:hypothetical protein [Candidatus Hydrogenedentota bacterium]
PKLGIGPRAAATVRRAGRTQYTSLPPPRSSRGCGFRDGKRGEKGQSEANFARNGARKLLDDGELEPSL